MMKGRPVHPQFQIPKGPPPAGPPPPSMCQPPPPPTGAPNLQPGSGPPEVRPPCPAAAGAGAIALAPPPQILTPPSAAPPELHYDFRKNDFPPDPPAAVEMEGHDEVHLPRPGAVDAENCNGHVYNPADIFEQNATSFPSATPAATKRTEVHEDTTNEVLERLQDRLWARAISGAGAAGAADDDYDLDLAHGGLDLAHLDNLERISCEEILESMAGEDSHGLPPARDGVVAGRTVAPMSLDDGRVGSEAAPAPVSTSVQNWGEEAGSDFWGEDVGSSGSSRGSLGLAGILEVIRMTDPEVNLLALGMDLTTLGLNLNSVGLLSENFTGPFLPAEGEAGGGGAEEAATAHGGFDRKEQEEEETGAVEAMDIEALDPSDAGAPAAGCGSARTKVLAHEKAAPAKPDARIATKDDFASDHVVVADGGDSLAEVVGGVVMVKNDAAAASNDADEDHAADAEAADEAVGTPPLPRSSQEAQLRSSSAASSTSSVHDVQKASQEPRREHEQLLAHHGLLPPPAEAFLPSCYYTSSIQKTTVAKWVQLIPKFATETLFYIFYQLAGDLLQAHAAQELYARGWKYLVRAEKWYVKLEAEVEVVSLVKRNCADALEEPGVGCGSDDEQESTRTFITEEKVFSWDVFEWKKVEVHELPMGAPTFEEVPFLEEEATRIISLPEN